MTHYNECATFGGVTFVLGDVIETRQPSTLKTKIGSTFIEKSIPLRNTVDIVLQINGTLDGRMRSAGQSVSTAIETERDALIALEDGYYHAYSDDKHSFNGVIKVGTLQFDDSADKIQGQPLKFTCTIIEWKT